VTARRWLLVGAVLTVVGLALAATAPIAGTDGAERARTQQVAGGVAVLLGWAALAWGIHRFGRMADVTREP
jgi:hypothetical protein